MARWPLLKAGEIHLWRAHLDVSPDALDHLRASLSDTEHERSAQFRFDLDRTRFIAARGWLRLLLARYLDSAASDITLTPGPQGKPQLGAGHCWLRFNVSHSSDLAVYAVARDREVGVDVELIRFDLEIDAISHHFSQRDRAALAARPQRDRLRAAFDYWTRKEALLKAVGVGLAVAPDQIDVSVGSGLPEHVRLRDADLGRPGPWSLHTFDAGAGYSAAVAMEGVARSVPNAAESLPRRIQPPTNGC